MIGGGAGGPRIVIVGAGFGGLESAFHLRKRLGRRASITVVADHAQFLFRPNLVYVPFGKEPDRYLLSVAPVLERRHIGFVHDRVERVDPAARVVEATGHRIGYDHLILATGATMRARDVPGLGEHGHAIWSTGDMQRLREAFTRVLERAAGGARSRVVCLVPPGNGCPGALYEVALMLDTWLRRHEARAAVDLGVATAEASFVAPFGPRLHDALARAFRERDIAARTGRVVTAVGPDTVHFDDGSFESCDLLVSFPAHEPSVRFAGLPHDARGFLRTVPGACQVEGHPEIYAVGDAGDFALKQAFVAMLQATAAAEHLAQRILGEPATARFEPMSVLILDHLDTATFAQARLRGAGGELTVDEAAPDLYKVGSGDVWRAGKKLIGTLVPARFRLGEPVHAGAAWTMLEAGLKVMSSAFAD